MPSPPLESTHGRTTSGVACHHRLWEAHTIKRRLAGHAIIAHGRQTRSNDFWRDMPSPPLDSTHGRTTLGMACYHHLWAAQTIERHSAGHARIAHGRQTRSNNVWHDMQSCLREAHTVERRRAWYNVTAFGHHTQSNVVGRDMPSSPLDSTHGRTKSGVACHHSP